MNFKLDSDKKFRIHFKKEISANKFNSSVVYGLINAKGFSQI